MVGSAERGEAKLVITSRSFQERSAWRALKTALPAAWLEGTEFRGVLILRAEGDAEELAARVRRHCAGSIGHVTPVLAEVPSEAVALREAAVALALQHIESGESFCFRVHRRGWPGPESSPVLERDVGGAIAAALQRRDETEPAVRLEHPDVTVIAEVLGRRTLIGLARAGNRGAAEPPTR